MASRSVLLLFLLLVLHSALSMRLAKRDTDEEENSISENDVFKEDSTELKKDSDNEPAPDDVAVDDPETDEEPETDVDKEEGPDADDGEDKEPEPDGDGSEEPDAGDNEDKEPEADGDGNEEPEVDGDGNEEPDADGDKDEEPDSAGDKEEEPDSDDNNEEGPEVDNKQDDPEDGDQVAPPDEVETTAESVPNEPTPDVGDASVTPDDGVDPETDVSFEGGFIFHSPFFNFEQVKRYFENLERAMEETFSKAMEEIGQIPKTYENTTEHTIEVNGHKYRVHTTVIMGGNRSRGVLIEAQTIVPANKRRKRSLLM